MSEFINVAGLDDLKKKLAAVPAEIATKVLRKGVNAAAQLIKAAAVADAPAKTGTLRRSAIVKFLRAESNATQVEYIVTFRKGKRAAKTGRDAFYASWVEFGHGGKVAPPHRFLKPAFDLNYHQALALELSTMRYALAKLPEFQ